MTTKLTLSIDGEIIKKAKKISRRQGKSLSKIVEEYLIAISNKDAKKISAVERLNSILEGKIVKRDLDWKKEKGEYLKKKYGL